MKKKLWNITVYTLLLVLLVTNVLQMAWHRDSYSKLEQLEALISQKFIGEADETLMEDAAARAMLEATGDRWSFYTPAANYAAFEEQMNNAYVGIGVTIRLQEESWGFLILNVTPESPAQEAGVLPGDVLIAIEGETTEGMDSETAQSLVRGPEGTSVNLTFRRGEQELTLEVERRKIKTVVAEGRMVSDDIGLVTIHNFDSRCAEETIAAIEDLLEEGAEKLIFDVRFNPGGFAHELVKVLDYLLPEGEVFHTVDYAGREQIDTSDASCLEVPMAVLVNGESYSAAEFFAVALQEYGVGIVVGEKTSGKGHFQQTYRLNDGSSVNLSVGKYFTPSGKSLEGVGITPDIELTVEPEAAFEILAGITPDAEDPQLQAAIQALEAE